MSFSLTLTPDEYKNLLMSRIEKSLAESGVSLPPTVRQQIYDCLPVPETLQVEAGDIPIARMPHKTKTTIREARAALAANKTTASGHGRRYRPTDRAKPIEKPRSIREKVLNLIIQKRVCILPDLVKGTHMAEKPLYNALWQLKRDKLIVVEPLSANEPTDAEKN